jgi:membrane-bound ClpP family serine protease
MRIVYELFKIMIGVIAGAGLLVFLNVNLHLFNAASQPAALSLSYADLAAINLTVATVVLGGVALIVAVVAVFGFQIIRTESVSNAEKRVKEELPAMLDRELRRMENDGRLSRVMERAMLSGGSEDDGSQSASED